jgi:hypothetical protein
MSVWLHAYVAALQSLTAAKLARMGAENGLNPGCYAIEFAVLAANRAAEHEERHRVEPTPLPGPGKQVTTP